MPRIITPFAPHSLFLLLTLTLFSCQDSRQKALDEIEDLRGRVISEESRAFDAQAADELTRAFMAFIHEHPRDTLVPGFLFGAGELMMTLGQSEGALTQFERLCRDYPEHGKADEALFMQAFIAENQLGDLGRARMLYGEFLRLYPSSDFADDAEACIRNLGKSPEEIIREFEAAADSSAGPV
ncbi:MAG TPA: tetratricopeptide repeat protein [Bacteroidales bacterium]|nr:tetratricopeptide repeat protein [Bacteroidales bacterium]HRZ76361.1 tetratricopeptide repeat protein [Bacteroidales bacterium]